MVSIAHDLLAPTLHYNFACPTGAIKAAFEYFANQAGIGIPEWVPTPGGRQYMAAVQALDTVVYRIIDERRLALDSGQRSAQVCQLFRL